jgi:CheY-like chemotaxis protein
MHGHAEAETVTTTDHDDEHDEARAAADEEHRLRRQVRELEGRLESAGQREEQLLARVGHELRNPLSAITTALSLMREMGEDDAHGQAERYRQIIERQVDLLRKAVDHLLDMAGIDSTPHPGVAEPRLPGEPGPAQPPLLGQGVLVVEDDPDGRAALSELLRLWGYSVTTADDGVAGVEHAVEQRPSVALVDIDLPGVDGYEVARRIREAHPDATPLLVAITGFGQPDDQRRALAAGFDLHLVKPVRPRDLAELLAKHAEKEAGTLFAGPGPLPIESE